MLEELPHRQFLEWQEYDKIEPIGGLRGDWQIASVCSLVANLAAARSGSRTRFTPKEFLLEFKEASEIKEVEKPEATPATPWQTMKFYARMFTAQANADENRKLKKKKR